MDEFQNMQPQGIANSIVIPPQPAQVIQQNMTPAPIKVPLQEYLGYFMGKMFVRNTNNGKKQYKAMFKKDLNDQYPIGFKCYDATKGIDILKDGEYYKVGYTIDAPYTNKTGQVVSNSKSALFFGVPTSQSQQTIQQSAQKPALDLNAINTFYDKYAQVVKSKNITTTAVHFVGAYMCNNHANSELVKALLQAYEAKQQQVVAQAALNEEDQTVEPDL